MRIVPFEQAATESKAQYGDLTRKENRPCPQPLSERICSLSPCTNPISTDENSHNAQPSVPSADCA